MSNSQNEGFSLLELSLVLLILVTLTGGLLTTQIARMTEEKQDITEQRMEAIAEQLLRFRQVQQRLPCPASYTVTIGSASFGREERDATNCTSTITSGSINLSRGAVPTKTLNLADEYLYDGWGRRFTYAVSQRFTKDCGFINNPISQAGYAGLTVQEQSDTTTDKGAYVLLSHGINGHGAYLRSGERLVANATNTSEQENCDCDATATDATPDHVFVTGVYQETAGDITNRFDDLLTFAVREQLRDRRDETGAAVVGVWNCPLTGFRIDAAVDSEYAGWALAHADMNGDGYDDLIIASRRGNIVWDGWNSGGVISVVFAQPDGSFPNPLPLSSLNGTNGFRAYVPCNSYAEFLCMTDLFYTAGVKVGDINGDGKRDIVFGGTVAQSNTGFVMVLFGRSTAWPAVVNAGTLNGSDGFWINGYLSAGWGMNGAKMSMGLDVGDINKDGYDDIVIGAPFSRMGGVSPLEQGSVDVVFGKATPFPVPFHVNTINGTNGFRLLNTYINGSYGARLGENVQVADITGDGYADIIANAFNEGAYYVVFGRAGAWAASWNIYGALNGTNGFRIPVSGWIPFAKAGDVNGDGIKDLVISQSTPAPRAVYVIFGKTSAWAASFDVATLNGTNGFKLTDSSAATWGGNVAKLQDINQDAFADIMIPVNTTTKILFGKASGWASTTDLGTFTFTGTNGFTVTGYTPENAWLADLAVLDMNKDGRKDLAIGSPAQDLGIPQPWNPDGATYVIIAPKDGSPWPATVNVTTLE